VNIFAKLFFLFYTCFQAASFVCLSLLCLRILSSIRGR
jgi:hypothetical protein